MSHFLSFLSVNFLYFGVFHQRHKKSSWRHDVASLYVRWPTGLETSAFATRKISANQPRSFVAHSIIRPFFVKCAWTHRIEWCTPESLQPSHRWVNSSKGLSSSNNSNSNSFSYKHCPHICNLHNNNNNSNNNNNNNTHPHLFSMHRSRRNPSNPSSSININITNHNK